MPLQERFDKCHEVAGLGAADLGQLLVDSRPVEAGMGARRTGARQSGLVACAVRECSHAGELLQGSHRLQIVSEGSGELVDLFIVILLAPLDQKTSTSA